ncbi:MAG: urease accessory protein UreD [Lachnospiraceae bacterium]
MTTELMLHIKNSDGRTVLEDCYFTSPLKIGTPNNEGERLALVLMMASAGVLKGDRFSYDIMCAAMSETTITDQSYTKIFNTGEGDASKEMKIQVQAGASLYYHPSAVIPFAGSSYKSDMQVHLAAESEFAYADILAAGRVGMGERFAFRRYHSRVCVSIEDSPVWVDNCLLEPGRMELDSLFFFNGSTHQGTFYYYGPEDKMEMLSQFTTEAPVLYGISRAAQGVCVRVLAESAQDIEEVFDEMGGKLHL